MAWPIAAMPIRSWKQSRPTGTIKAHGPHRWRRSHRPISPRCRTSRIWTITLMTVRCSITSFRNGRSFARSIVSPSARPRSGAARKRSSRRGVGRALYFRHQEIPMKTFALAAATATLALAGCASGTYVSKEQSAQFQVGTTTEQQVLAALGEPDAKAELINGGRRDSYIREADG